MSSIHENQTSKRSLFGSPRTLLAVVCLAMILISSGFALSPLPENPGSPNLHSESLRSERAQLRCFANAIYGATKPGDSILLELPRSHSEGGLVTERLRYVLPGRQLFTTYEGSGETSSSVTDYLAVWKSKSGGNSPILRRCGGVLRRSESR